MRYCAVSQSILLKGLKEPLCELEVEKSANASIYWWLMEIIASKIFSEHRRLLNYFIVELFSYTQLFMH